MKNLILKSVLFLSLTIALVSCNKDDAPAANAEVSIVGKWEPTEIIDNTTGLSEVYEHAAGCTKDNYVFSATNIVLNEYDNFNSPCELDSQTIAYTKSGNTLTTPFGSVTITVLTATELRYIDGSETYVFKRI